MSLTLTRIDHNGPVTMRQLGRGLDGIVWTVHPDDFDALVVWVNANGGPSMYAIEPVTVQPTPCYCDSAYHPEGH